MFWPLFHKGPELARCCVVAPDEPSRTLREAHPLDEGGQSTMRVHIDLESRIPLFDVIMCVSRAVDLVSPAVANHHKQVAYIAGMIGAELHLSAKERNELALAGALHDIGALSLKERLDILHFEFQEPH